MKRLSRALLSLSLGATALIGVAPAAHACDPNGGQCNKPTDKVVCVVRTVVFFDGEPDDFVRAVAGCLVHP